MWRIGALRGADMNLNRIREKVAMRGSDFPSRRHVEINDLVPVWSRAGWLGTTNQMLNRRWHPMNSRPQFAPALGRLMISPYPIMWRTAPFENE